MVPTQTQGIKSLIWPDQGTEAIAVSVLAILDNWRGSVIEADDAGQIKKR